MSQPSLELALQLVRDQGPQAAIPHLKQLLESTASPKAQGLLGLCHFQLGQFAQAVEQLDGVPPGSPEHATARLYAARARLELAGQHTPPDSALLEQATRLFQAAIRADATDGKAWLGLAHAHHLRKENQKALHCVEQSVAADSRLNFDDMDALVFGCSIHFQSGNWKGLTRLVAQLETISVASEERKKSSLLLAKLAARLTYERAWQQASLTAEAAARLAPEDAQVMQVVHAVREAWAPRVVLARAEDHLRKSELLEAHRLYQGCTANTDAEVRLAAWLGLARIHYAGKEYCEALQCLDSVRDMQSRSPLWPELFQLRCQLQAERRDWHGVEATLGEWVKLCEGPGERESGAERLCSLTMDFCRRRIFSAARRTASAFMGLLPSPQADRLLAIVINLCACAQQQDRIPDAQGLAYAIVELEIEGLLGFLTGQPGPGWRESEEVLQRFRQLDSRQRQQCLRELRDWGQGCVTQHLLVEELVILHEKLGSPVYKVPTYTGDPAYRQIVADVRRDIPQAHSVIVFRLGSGDWLRPVAISSPLLGLAAIEPLRQQGSLLGQAIQLGGVLRVADTQDSDLQNFLPERGILVLPLRRGEKLLGCLYLGGPEQVFCECDQDWLEGMRESICAALG